MLNTMAIATEQAYAIVLSRRAIPDLGGMKQEVQVSPWFFNSAIKQ